jgi:hypothetical protein
VDRTRVVVNLAPGPARTFKVLLWKGPKKDQAGARERMSALLAGGDLAPLLKPGPARWTKPIVTRGERGPEDGPFAIDTLTVPMNAAVFSYVDYLLFTDGAKFNALIKLLKTKMPTRDALQKTFAMSPIEFETQWKAWVLATYPKV